MKIFLIIISIINILLVVLFGVAFWVAATAFSSSNGANSVIPLIIIIGCLLCVVLPWILFLSGRQSNPGIAGATKWTAFGFSLLPLAFTIFWFLNMGFNNNTTPIRPPDDAVLYETD